MFCYMTGVTQPLESDQSLITTDSGEEVPFSPGNVFPSIDNILYGEMSDLDTHAQYNAEDELSRLSRPDLPHDLTFVYKPSATSYTHSLSMSV